MSYDTETLTILLDCVKGINDAAAINATGCDNAVLLAMALERRKKALLAMARQCTAAVEQMKVRALDYAKNHANYLHEPFTVVKSLDNGHELVSGARKINDVVYEISESVGSIKPKAGNMTQAVLEQLPDDWTKTVFALDTENINALGVTDSELERYHLERPLKIGIRERKEVDTDVPEK